MFKKTLVAVSLLAAFSASAIDVNYDSGNSKYNDPDKLSIEGNAVNPKLDIEAFDIILGAGTYLANDLITLTFTGGELDFATALPTTIPVAAVSNSNTATLTLEDGDSTFVTYKVTSPTAGSANTFVGSKIAITKGLFKFDAKTIQDSLSVKVTAKRNNTAWDAEGNDNSVLFTKAAQFKGEVKTPFKSVIDVNADRLTFESKAVTSVLTLSFVNDSANVVSDATASAINYTVNGDFSFLDSDPSKDGIQLHSATKVVPSSVKTDSLKVEADKISWVDETVSSADPTLTIDVSDKDGKAAAAALSTQTFTAEADVVYGPSTDTDKVTADLFSGAAGSWTLNGATVDIPYVPVGEGLSQFIWVSNKGSKSGDITVSVIGQDGAKYGPYALGTAKPGLTPIAADIVAKLKEDGLTSGRVQMNVTVNAPDAAIEVYAAYKVDAADDRLALPTK